MGELKFCATRCWNALCGALSRLNLDVVVLLLKCTAVDSHVDVWNSFWKDLWRNSHSKRLKLVCCGTMLNSHVDVAVSAPKVPETSLASPGSSRTITQRFEKFYHTNVRTDSRAF
eukprot:611063-Rhodomonas_salina.1